MNPRRPNQTPVKIPRLTASQIRVLERLCRACGVSGDEGEVRKIVLEAVRPLAHEVKVDALGNVLAIHHGSIEPRLRVMIAAHMDEVGLMILNDEGEGIFRFDTVGGVDAGQLAGKSVYVGPGRLPGVIGVKPVHLLKYEERNLTFSRDDLRVDVSPDCGKKVRLGDRVTFATEFKRVGSSILAKALDDRVGVATLIELLRNPPANIDLLAAFTVQEEVGLRGAKPAAYTLNPDLAIILDCTPAHDLPVHESDGFQAIDTENSHYNTRLGDGPAIYIADRATFSDPRLIRHMIRTGEELKIPYQLRQPGGGGTDAGAIHKQRLGIPSVSVSVPARYPHTGAMLIRLEDWRHTMALVGQALLRLPVDILASDR